MSDHISITQAEGTWVVRTGGAVIGESKQALELREGDYPPVIYFPRSDIGMAFLDSSTHQTHCPHKGDASYFSVSTPAETLKNAAWSYETPINGVAEIAGHVAFDTSQVNVEKL